MQDIIAIAIAVGALMWLIQRIRRSLSGTGDGCGGGCGSSCARTPKLQHPEDQTARRS